MLLSVESETKQDLSDPGLDSTAYEMESIVVSEVQKVAEEKGTPSEHQEHAEQGVAEEKETSKVDLSKQEATAIDMKDEQHQTHFCAGNAHPKGSQSLQGEDGKNCSESSGESLKTELPPECNDFKDSSLLVDADPKKIPKENLTKKESCDNNEDSSVETQEHKF